MCKECKVIMWKISAGRKVGFVIFLFMIMTIYTVYMKCAVKTDFNEPLDGFYSYVLKKGISIQQISKGVYRISHLKWYCDIDTSVAKHFTKKNISWKDIFETRIEVLSKTTVFSPEELRTKIGVLPKDGTPVTIVARQGNVSIPKENVIIRLNRHGPLNARTTMVMTWYRPIKTIAISARRQPKDEIIHWMHYTGVGKVKDLGLWNTSHPLVIPEQLWGLENLTYYRGPLFFMKGNYSIGNFAKCNFSDFIGMAALYRIAHVKGTVTTLGFSTNADGYIASEKRVQLLAHKLAWSYYAVKELTDTSAFRKGFVSTTLSFKGKHFSDIFLKLRNSFIYLTKMITTQIWNFCHERTTIRSTTGDPL